MIHWRGALFGCVLLLCGAGGAGASPILMIDMNPAASGVQTSLTVATGAIFTVDVVVSEEGSASSFFDTVIVELSSNDSGAVVGPGPTGPVAGAAAGNSFLTMDAFSVSFTSPGAPLTVFPAFNPAPGFVDSSGAFGLFDPLAFLVGASPLSLFRLEYVALSPGTSQLFAAGSPFGVPELSLAGMGISSRSFPGSVTVLPPGGTVPEPGTLWLLLLGAFGARALRRSRRV